MPRPLSQGRHEALEAMDPLHLTKATREHLLQMVPWFPSQDTCRVWGGPEFRFPFTAETFLADSKYADLPSYALIRGSTEVCGFGQFYLRAGRCHLSRLAISPGSRGQGLGTQLIGLLQKAGKEQLGTTEYSLFVSVTNKAAKALYERLGFTCAPYPEEGLAIPDSHYMVAS
jgi:ribosomal protein S18 acetylase RimI-like enzyme